MHELINTHFAPAFGIKELADAAIVENPRGRLALTTDCYVVSPLFFPGGNIGELAINGAVNDLAVMGARPLYLTAGFIIEEGFKLDDLRRIVSSMAEASKKAGVRVAAGDTKVVERGKGDGIFITTSGVGVLPDGVELSTSRISPGDMIIVSGKVGSHGISVMAERNGLTFEPPVTSDTRALNGLAEAMLARAAGAIKAMRDPTRGGIATTLKEFALSSGLCMAVNETVIPVAPGVRGACDILGLDPLYVANEGVLLAVAGADVAEYLLEMMKSRPEGVDSAIIGTVEAAPASMVLLKTGIGGARPLDMLQGEQLPRIC